MILGKTHFKTTCVWEDVSARVTDVFRSQNRDKNGTTHTLRSCIDISADQNVLF